MNHRKQQVTSSSHCGTMVRAIGMAHTIVQDIESSGAAAIHAYLHRKEGDLGNAGYWYRRARRAVHSGSLEQEWRELVEKELGN